MNCIVPTGCIHTRRGPNYAENCSRLKMIDMETPLPVIPTTVVWVLYNVLTHCVFLLAGCPAPFVELSTGCYYASDAQVESWTGSRLACQELSGDLAVITSEEEQTAINGYLATVYPGNKSFCFEYSQEMGGCSVLHRANTKAMSMSDGRALVDLRGRQGPNSFIFMQFSANN